MATQGTVVVTGASTGIGYAIAKWFTTRGWRVFGSVRKPADGERLQRELGGSFTPLLFDVTDTAAIKAAAAQVESELGGATLNGLVNNAGLVVAGPLLHLPEDDFRYQLDVNVLGPFRVTQAFAPLLGADRARTGKPGRIVQMSSVGGTLAFPFIGPYNASKFALNGMSTALRRELLLYGIDVLTVAPGAIATPIWDKANDIPFENYAHTEYEKPMRRFKEYFDTTSRKIALPPEAVARDVWHALTAAKPKLTYWPVPKKLTEFTLPRLLPQRMVDKRVAKMLGFAKK